jgi:uncharacterized membrane protein
MNANAGQPADHRSYRLGSIDMLRGLVIIIMALDHTRDFFMAGATQDPMSDPNATVPLFFTRWITHFCAPVFVFLAGTSAGLMVARKTPAELAKFLITRGFWLVFIEIAVVSTAISFSPFGDSQFGGKTFLMLQVIWAIGVGMIVLGLCQFLGRRVCLLLGALIVLGHNALDPVWPTLQDYPQGGAPLWIALHTLLVKPLGPFFLISSYPVLPWVGTILLGFGSSALFELPAERRQRSLIRWGLAITAGFLVLRALDIYGDPNHWESQAGGPVRTALDFLNTTKYGPSLLFLMMTLGPAAIFCAFAERWSGWLKDTLVMYGRVPFAFYIVHWYLLHSLCLLLAVVQGFPASSVMTVPGAGGFPEGFGVPLPGVYLVWLVVIVGLYPWVRYVSGVKARNRSWWLSYV